MFLVVFFFWVVFVFGCCLSTGGYCGCLVGLWWYWFGVLVVYFLLCWVFFGLGIVWSCLCCVLGCWGVLFWFVGGSVVWDSFGVVLFGLVVLFGIVV